MSKHLTGFAASVLTLITAVAAAADNEVTIHRDSWGVPHIYADTAAAGVYGLGYTQAEDRLDKLEQEIADVIEDNRNVPTYWTHITYAGQSSVQPVEISGVPYITEAIPVRVEVLG